MSYNIINTPILLGVLTQTTTMYVEMDMAQKRLRDTQTQSQQKHEDLLIAIDQLEQLTEVMGEVLTRVKQQVATLDPPAVASKAIESNKKQKTHPSHKTKKRSIVH